MQSVTPRGLTFEGTPCEKGHTIRYFRGGGCRECMLETNRQPHVVEARNLFRRTKYKEDISVRVDRKNRNLLEHYGLTITEREEMLVAQGYECALCSTQDWENPRGLAVDHDHETGKIRALLCTPCNLALGSLRDDPLLAEKAAAYLRKHGRI